MRSTDGSAPRTTGTARGRRSRSAGCGTCDPFWSGVSPKSTSSTGGSRSIGGSTMNTLRRSMALALLGAGAVFGQARAEVSAELDAFGSYVRTVVETGASVRNPRIWAVSRFRIGHVALNSRGDKAGDLFPAVAEDASHQRWPWVVWSHFNGQDYDLVWSRWDGRGWSPTTAVVPGIDRSDAVDPAVAVSADGRPCAVWLS